MSKKAISPKLESEAGLVMEGPVSRKVTNASLNIQCSKCGCSDVSESIPQRFDNLKARFIARNSSDGPYRCLRCHHRFWGSQSDDLIDTRIWTLVFVAMMFGLLALEGYRLWSGSNSGREAAIVAADDIQDDLDQTLVQQSTTAGDSTPSLASLINMPLRGSDQSSEEMSERSSNASREFTSYEEPLTPEQKAMRLTYAKQEAEHAERLSQARIEQLDRILSPGEDELASLVRIEVGHALERWREAWSRGDVDAYLVNYSDGFEPSDDLSIDVWKASRRSRVTPEKNIKVELSNFDISMLEELNSGVIEFNQRYESGSYVENSRKRLNLAKEQGAWKITSEVELK